MDPHRNRQMADLWHRIRCHQTEDVSLNAFIKLNSLLELIGVERLRKPGLDLTIRSCLRMRGVLIRIGSELGAQVMIDIQLAWRRRRKVG